MKLSHLAAAILLTVAGLTGCAPSQPGEGLLVQHQVTIQPPPPPTVRLTFVGDLMLARLPGEAIARGEDPFASFAAVLTGSDYSVGNLESVIATGGKRVPKAYNFRASPKAIPLLARYFQAVSVANNHSGDFGKDALAEELDLLTRGGLPYFGGGMDFAEAHAPLIVEKNGIRIALLGYSEIELRSFEAGPATPGTAWSDDAQVVADISAARTRYKADLVIPFLHWGLEYHFKPSERQRSLAHKLIDAGADVVVGGHPHVTQGAEYYKDRLIVYSLGNFVFDDFKDVTADLGEPSRTSWVLRLTLTRTGLQSWDTVVARTDDNGFPRPVKGAVSPCGSAESRAIGQCAAK